MARVVLAALARSAAIDRFKNHLSLFEIVEELQVGTDDPAGLQALAGGDPVPLPGFNMCFVTLTMRSDVAVPESAKMRVVLRMPSGKEHIGPETNVDLQSTRAFRNVGNIPALPVSGVGMYRFEVELASEQGWEIAASYPFLVGSAPVSVVAGLSTNQTRD